MNRPVLLLALCAMFTLTAGHSASAQQRVGGATAQQRIDAATFARTASSSDDFEVQSSQLALQRSTNPRVRAFAQQMINDHSRTRATLQQTAPMLMVSFGILDARHAGMLSQLAALNGPSFDRLYAQMQLAGHREAVALFSAYAAAGDDPRLVGFARSTLPHLRHHLAMARRL